MYKQLPIFVKTTLPHGKFYVLFKAADVYQFAILFTEYHHSQLSRKSDHAWCMKQWSFTGSGRWERGDHIQESASEFGKCYSRMYRLQ